MQVSKETVIRTVLLAIALINQALTSTGHSILPFSDDEVTEVISLVFTLITSAVAWWKNNSFTSAAIAADEYMNTIKEHQEETKK